jgi:hypothetical protein
MLGKARPPKKSILEHLGRLDLLKSLFWNTAEPGSSKKIYYGTSGRRGTLKWFRMKQRRTAEL